jgi:hypothetical protein
MYLSYVVYTLYKSWHPILRIPYNGDTNEDLIMKLQKNTLQNYEKW